MTYIFLACFMYWIKQTKNKQFKFAVEKSVFLSKIRETDTNLLNYIDSVLLHALLLGKLSLNTITNMLVLYATTDFILSTKHFKKHLSKINIFCYAIIIHPNFSNICWASTLSFSIFYLMKYIFNVHCKLIINLLFVYSSSHPLYF